MYVKKTPHRNMKGCDGFSVNICYFVKHKIHKKRVYAQKTQDAFKNVTHALRNVWKADKKGSATVIKSRVPCEK